MSSQIQPAQHTTNIDGRIDENCYPVILKDELQQTIYYYHKSMNNNIFNRTVNLSILIRRLRSGYKMMSITVIKWHRNCVNTDARLSPIGIISTES